MKNRKIIIACFLLCAALLMGIGYADLVGFLSIGTNMTMTKDNNDMKVVFTDAAIIAEDAGKGTATVNTDTTTATIEVTGLSAKGEHLTATFTMKNNTPDVTATIKMQTIADSEAYTVTHTFDKVGVQGADGTDDKTITLAPNATYTFTVTITLEKTVVENHSHSFSIDFDVTGASVGNAA